jgi:hypothetical protein
LAEYKERKILLSYLEERFGISSKLFDDFLFFKRKQAWFILRRSPQIISVSNYKIEKAGLKSFRKVSTYIKPTTRFIQLFGHSATKNKIAINENQLSNIIEEGEIDAKLNTEQGYVILSVKGKGVLGLGFYGTGRIKSQLPKKSIKVL